jgi:hypothetical protein
MSTRTQRREAAEAAVQEWLGAHTEAWTKARELAESIGRPWRSTARALARLVARGVVRQKIQQWRDGRYRPRETKLYQGIAEFRQEGWPEWALPRLRATLPPGPKKPPRLGKTPPRVEAISPAAENEEDEFLMGVARE